VAVNAMKRSAAAGMTDEGIASRSFRSAEFCSRRGVRAGHCAIRKPETHKRLCCASISLLDAAVARWFLTFLAPPALGRAGPGDHPAAFVAYLLLVVAMVFDWRTRGRPHPVRLTAALRCSPSSS